LSGTGSLAQHLRDDHPKLWDAVRNQAPGDLEIHTAIAMHRKVAEGFDAPPLHLWVAGLQGVGQFADGFTNDIEALQRGRLENARAEERLPALGADLLNVGNGLQNVAQQILGFEHRSDSPPLAI